MNVKNNISNIDFIWDKWNIYSKETKFLFYSPITKKIILSAKENEKYENPNLKVFPMTFFNDSLDSKWKDLKKDCINFEYCFEVDKSNIDFNHIENKEKLHLYKRSERSYEDWSKGFNRVIEKIKNKDAQKVVISREIEFICDSEVDVKSVITKLIKNNPESFVFAYYRNGKTFLGATPEILVEKKGSDIMSYALAGTVIKNGKEDEKLGKELLNDEKNNHEHNIVINDIVDNIGNVTDKVEIGETELLELKNLFHLRTIIKAEDDTLNLEEWAKCLHPTPAIGGKPREAAMNIIKESEKHSRGMYAAPIGIVDRNGDGIFVVGIRSALIIENKIYAYAGCGIVEQSDCKAEYNEIENKLNTIIECL